MTTPLQAAGRATGFRAEVLKKERGKPWLDQCLAALVKEAGK